MGMNTVIRIIKHAESYEARNDNPGRRSINNRMSPNEAEEAAKALARNCHAWRKKMGRRTPRQR
jgi:hypothetical protein